MDNETDNASEIADITEQRREELKLRAAELESAGRES